jgi:hypothetical protein
MSIIDRPRAEIVERLRLTESQLVVTTQRAEAAERNLADLRTAAIKYYNQSPREGDYALMLLSLAGTVKPEQPEMMREYNAARKALRDAIEAIDRIEQPPVVKESLTTEIEQPQEEATRAD